ncbi:alpha/beta hydrolase [Galbibacter sp. EGI 63066]|uniref:alpha/beta hydrolase n=1 Tax=Galbibacter sp. EGI 63066 TaxID=2993559 RepID=UPI002248D6B9|nr:alpha/beta hydrolase [Galbibacter sp. EGI 63066]MCX2678458.1 alpha/beta hydrolase [Galbibacter sp. EGI 63066]
MKDIVLCTLALLSSLSLFAQHKETFTYAVKGGESLKMDVYSPEKIAKDQKLPVLLWIHGGGFSGGSRDNKNEVELCKYVTGKGYIGVSISYRLLRKGTTTAFGCDCTKEEKLETFKQATIDYMDAAEYLVKYADELQIDTTKIIAGGSSAGAETVLSAVFMKEYYIDEANKYSDINFAGIFSLAGAMINADYITKENAVPGVFFHGTDDNLVPFANAPHHYCEKDKAGYLMLDGSAVIAEKLEKLEMPYYFQVVKNAKHEVSGIPFTALDEVFGFFDRTLFKNEIVQTKVISTK